MIILTCRSAQEAKGNLVNPSIVLASEYGENNSTLRNKFYPTGPTLGRIAADLRGGHVGMTIILLARNLRSVLSS
jgi:hypothetical protein